MGSGRPTIDDVARLAGVGRATVSRVLNGGPNVRDEVRANVMAAVERLQYKVNVQARFLAGGRSQVIALIYASDLDSEPNSFYYSGLELGALRTCSQMGFQLQLHNVNQHSLTKTAKILDLVESRRVDGVVLTPPFSDDVELIRHLVATHVPLVCISPGYDAQRVATGVGIDDEVAGYEMTRYLLSLGHRSFGFIKGLPGHLSAEERFQGFQRALREAHIPDEAVHQVRGNFTFKSGVEMMPQVVPQGLTGPNRPTALICANDDMAVGAIFSAHKMGLSLPQDLSIVGFDDTPVSEIIWPPLTTVHQPLKAIGARAIEMVIERINGDPALRTTAAPNFEVIAHRVVKRESAARPPV